MNHASACTACGGALSAPLAQPVVTPCHSAVLVDDAAQASAFPVASVELRRCGSCGLVQNAVFDPAHMHYDTRYEGSQLYSGRFRDFARELADRLAARFGLDAGSRVVEVGCGQGDFLELLCARSGCDGVGIDPAARDGAGVTVAVERVRGPVEAHLHRLRGADLVLCRHTLEHIHRPVDFLAALGRGMDDGTPLFVDVPGTRRILAEGAFWDVYYEHCNYFVGQSLAAVVEAAGFAVEAVSEAFDEQSLEIVARLGAAGARTAGRSVSVSATDPVEGFGERLQAARERWQHRLGSMPGNCPVVLWGAGSKAVAFLAALGNPPVVVAAVDINPVKQRCFLPGSAVPVIAPAALPAVRPALVVAMNPVYREEIRRSLSQLGLDTPLACPNDVDLDAAT